jgi:hypothetical protein
LKLTREHLAYVRKGLIAVAGALAALALALTEVSPAGEAITSAEWVGVATAALSALGVVVVPNGPKPE